ncbi:MAG: DAK2 domain-containing protein [Actinomycetes bacterium]
MANLTTLSAADLHKVITTYADLLRSHKEVINRLNVYPVPDGDTGTNMTLTIESVVAELPELAADPDMLAVCKAVSHGSLMGARGNSGVILSQLLRGLMEKLRDSDAIEPAALADALTHADILARQAVVRPIEGTILSVARAAAVGASSATGSMENVVRSARGAAAAALAYTPEQLPVLKQAGVVDSGGTGLLLLLDAFSHVVTGDPLPIAPELDTIEVHAQEPSKEHGEGGIADLRYEVMYLLDAEDSKMSAFKEVWAGIGDSIVIVGGEGLYNCHIHTDDIGAAIEAALDAGRPRQIRITDLLDEVVEEKWVREGRADHEDDVSDEPAPPTAIVAVVVGEGVARIFRSLGVRTLVKGGQSMNPSTAELVEAAKSTGSAEVVILPNNKNIRPVAEQVGTLVDFPVTVVPTNSIVEGFAALIAYDPSASAAENAKEMSEAASRVIAAEITQAVRDTTTDAGEVHVGDWIGLTGKGVISIAESVSSAANRLFEKLMTPEHELITIIEGEGATQANTRRITEFLHEKYPDVEVETHPGGQPLYPYLFGIE